MDAENFGGADAARLLAHHSAGSLGSLNTLQITVYMGNEKNSTTSKVSDTDTYAHMLYLSNFLREPIISSAFGPARN